MTRCVICRSDFKRRSMTQKACSPDCAERYGREKAIADADKQKRKEAKADRLDTRERKEKLKRKSDVVKEVQIIVNRYVRERDLIAGYGCISCGTMKSPRWDAGHFRSVGSAPHLRFDADRNIHLQCAKCNTFLAGHLLAYRDELPKRIGAPSFEALIADQAPRHYTIEGLQNIKSIFKERLKGLKNE